MGKDQSLELVQLVKHDDIGKVGPTGETIMMNLILTKKTISIKSKKNY